MTPPHCIRRSGTAATLPSTTSSVSLPRTASPALPSPSPAEAHLALPEPSPAEALPSVPSHRCSSKQSDARSARKPKATAAKSKAKKSHKKAKATKSKAKKSHKNANKSKKHTANSAEKKPGVAEAPEKPLPDPREKEGQKRSLALTTVPEPSGTGLSEPPTPTLSSRSPPTRSPSSSSLPNGLAPLLRKPRKGAAGATEKQQPEAGAAVPSKLEQPPDTPEQMQRSIVENLQRLGTSDLDLKAIRELMKMEPVQAAPVTPAPVAVLDSKGVTEDGALSAEVVEAAMKKKEEERKAAHARYMRFSRSLQSQRLSVAEMRCFRDY